MKDKKIDEAIMGCYRELYANSTPPASFDELLENATTNEIGQKVIRYNDYEIEEEKFEEIVKDAIKYYKIKKSIRVPFRNTILFGCSPRFIRKDI